MSKKTASRLRAVKRNGKPTAASGDELQLEQLAAAMPFLHRQLMAVGLRPGALRFTFSQISDIWGISTRTLRRYVESGDLRAKRIGRELGVTLEEWERFQKDTDSGQRMQRRVTRRGKAE